MALLSPETLRGFVPAVVTPFTSNGEIIEDAFVHIVEWLIDNGANGICVAGDNGESWTLDVGERQRLTRLAVNQVGGRVPVMTGVSAPCSAQSIKYARAAIAAGACGILLMAPTYVMKASREELVRHFATIAKAVDIPIVLYNSPRRTGIELSLGDIDAIMGVAPVIGIKESNRDFFHHTHLLHQFRERIAVMIGPCHYIIPGLALGARGFIATGPEFLGADAGRLTTLARTAPGLKHNELHYKLTVIYQALMGTGTWPAALKAALNLIGQPAGVPRDPVMPLVGTDLDRLRRMLGDLGLLAA